MAKPICVYIIRGGFVGWDGMVVSAGMDWLGRLIRRCVPGKVTVRKYNWSDGVGKTIDADIRKQTKGAITVVIGYSGGGWKAMDVRSHVDLMVGYDPSPKWKIDPHPRLGSNVKKALCYHCPHPMFFGFGGALWKGPQVQVMSMWRETHMTIQWNRFLHEKTINAIEDCRG